MSGTNTNSITSKLIPLSIFILFIAGSLYAITSCGNNNIDSRKIVLSARDQFGLEKIVIQEHPSQVFVLADISGSMAGFANNTDFPVRLSKLHASLAGVGKKYFTLSNTVQEVPDHLGLLSREIYTGSVANFGLISDLIDSGGAVIILTDFQFNNSEYFAEMVDLFQTLIANNRYVSISESMAPFSGTIYTQDITPRQTFHSDEKRPLFAVVLSDKKYSKYLDDVLSGSGIWEHNLPLTLDQISAIKIRTEYDIDPDYPVKIMLQNSAIKYWDNISSNDIRYDTYDIVMEADEPRNTLNNISLTTVDISGETLTLQFDFSKQIILTPQLFRIRVKPSVIPQWISSISCTAADGALAQISKTLWFDRFINEATSSVANPFVIINEFSVVGDVY